MRTLKTAKRVALILLVVSPALIAPAAFSGMTLAPAVACDGHQLGLMGDVNGDCHRNLLDVVQLIKAIVDFPSDPLPITGDVNCDHLVNSVDVVILIDFLFRQAPEPVCPQ